MNLWENYDIRLLSFLLQRRYNFTSKSNAIDTSISDLDLSLKQSGETLAVFDNRFYISRWIYRCGFSGDFVRLQKEREERESEREWERVRESEREWERVRESGREGGIKRVETDPQR